MYNVLIAFPYCHSKSVEISQIINKCKKIETMIYTLHKILF